ncbi:hypothetical protein BGZ99_000120 [Dissophora globulifera]|uniref:PB1 domain-containing protein n=1 Tax=Dissophora globulifera TaxID=979702 RepID=A0A9P6UYM6_9FUNG|nr:hypothetical protein BGZ99_000120 [Dissophora globulifera]
MASYESLRKLTIGDKPVVIKFKCAGTNLRVPIAQVPTFNELCFIVQRLFRSEVSADLDNLVLRYQDDDGDLITIQDDADISHAISLSSVLRLTVNDKITHPVVLPLEDLPKRLASMDEKQTVAAVTASLVDLHAWIGRAIQVIQSQHPTSSTIVKASGRAGENGSNTVLREKTEAATALESKPLVLSAESLDQLLEPRKSLLARQTSVSSQASSSMHNAQSPPLRSQPAPSQPTLTNVGTQLQQQQQQWTPQPVQLSNGLQPPQQQQQQSTHPSPAPANVTPAQSYPQQQQQYNQAHAIQQQQPQPQQPQQQQPQPQPQPQPQQVVPAQVQPQQQYNQYAAPQQQPVQNQAQIQRQSITPQQQQQYALQNQPYTPVQQSQGQGQGYAPPQQQQQQPPQQQQVPTQQQQTPYLQSQPSPAAFATNPFGQQQQPQQQYPAQAMFSPGSAINPNGSAPFTRSNSVYVPQQQQQQQQQQQHQLTGHR